MIIFPEIQNVHQIRCLEIMSFKGIYRYIHQKLKYIQQMSLLLCIWQALRQRVCSVNNHNQEPLISCYKMAKIILEHIFNIAWSGHSRQQQQCATQPGVKNYLIFNEKTDCTRTPNCTKLVFASTGEYPIIQYL